MIKTTKWIVSMTLTTTMMMGSVLVMAQDPPATAKPRINPVYGATLIEGGQEKVPPPPAPVQVPGTAYNTVGIIATEASFDTQVIMAAPFSAVVVTESTQVLADGNRIVHKSSSAISRDAQGRTRREQAVTYMTSQSTTPETYQTIWINDPVAGFNYTLNTKDRVAQKSTIVAGFMRTGGAAGAVGGGGGGGRGGAMPTPTGGTLRTVAPAGQPGTVGGAVGGGMGARRASPSGEPPSGETGSSVGGGAVYSRTTSPVPSQGNRIEAVGGTRAKPEVIQLGKQSFEGVEAEGTKTVITIPAGQIGNEQPIVIENESWYSAELHQVVMSRHSDPRYGESTYKLTNINRGEPDHSLFEVPSDYTVREPSMVRPMMKKKMEDEKEPPQ